MASMQATLAPYLPKLLRYAHIAPIVDLNGYARSPLVGPGNHFALFSKTRLETERIMGPDGSDMTYNPPGPYNRRMWAGGECEFARTELSFMHTFVEFTNLDNVEVRKRSNGEDMIVVTVKKFVLALLRQQRYPFYNELRQWVFLKENKRW